MDDRSSDLIDVRETLDVDARQYTIYRLQRLAEQLSVDLTRMPFSIKVVLESLLRNVGDGFTTPEDVVGLAHWTPESAGTREIDFKPARVLLQDFTGVPAVVVAVAALACVLPARRTLAIDPVRALRTD